MSSTYVKAVQIDSAWEKTAEDWAHFGHYRVTELPYNDDDLMEERRLLVEQSRAIEKEKLEEKCVVELQDIQAKTAEQLSAKLDKLETELDKLQAQLNSNDGENGHATYSRSPEFCGEKKHRKTESTSNIQISCLRDRTIRHNGLLHNLLCV
jgi:ribosomal protein L29